jgi:hypothetical protein
MTSPPATAPDATVLSCQQCSGALQVGLLDKTTNCPWCGSGNIVRRPPRPGRPAPSFVIGFSRQSEEARAAVKAWAKRVSFWAPRSFRKPDIELLKPVYVPAYLVSGVARGEWKAQCGYEYTTTKVGKKGGLERTTATEWHSVGAPYSLRVHDLLLSASQRLSNDELQHLEPYDLGRLARYSDAAIAGWPAEEPARDTDSIDDALMKEVQAALAPRLRGLVPGEKVSDFSFTTQLSDPAFATVLVPVWTMLVRWSETKPRVRVLVNGQTGKVFGKPPTSWLKVTLAVLLGLGALGAAIWWLSHGGRLR